MEGQDVVRSGWGVLTCLQTSMKIYLRMKHYDANSLINKFKLVALYWLWGKTFSFLVIHFVILFLG